jgi:Fic family protein
MDWTKFTFDYHLDTEVADLSRHVINIEAYKLASLNLVLPPDWREQLDKLNRARQIHGTTALEGNPLSETDVLKQIEALDKTPDDPAVAHPKNRLYVQTRNADVAQRWVRQRFAPNTPPLNCEDILKMHWMLTQESDIEHNEPGKWRTFSVTVGSAEMGGVHRGAPHRELPRLMEEFVHFVESRRMDGQHPVVRALLAHFFLVTIHPFGDGNGRISRLVEAGILFQQGYNVHGFYGLSNYFYQHENAYKTRLQKCRETQPFDVTPFIQFGIEGFAAELMGINNFIKTKLNRIVYRTMLVRAYNRKIGSYRRVINTREYQLLDFLLIETEPTDPFSENPSRQLKYSALTESPYVKGSYKSVTMRTFYRELFRLDGLGFIKITRDETEKDWNVELNFEAIGKY